MGAASGNQLARNNSVNAPRSSARVAMSLMTTPWIGVVLTEGIQLGEALRVGRDRDQGRRLLREVGTRDRFDAAERLDHVRDCVRQPNALLRRNDANTTVVQHAEEVLEHRPLIAQE